MKAVIGISGINATDNPGPGVGIARSLKEANPEMKLIGLSYDVHDPGHHMTNLFDNSYLLPFPAKGKDGYFDALEKVKKETGMNLLIPALDAELPILIRFQKELVAMGIRTALPTEEQFELRNKDKLTELSKELNCKHPKTMPVFSVDELTKVLESDFEYPLIVKGNYYKAYIAHNVMDAIHHFLDISKDWGYPILVQEFVTGQELNLIGLSDGKGNLCGSVTIKKQLTTSLGKVWTAVTISNPQMTQLCEDFCAVTNWNGPFELECISSGKELYLIEINPRFPAWVYFATGVGINLPNRLLHLIGEGQCETENDYKVGQCLIRYSYEMIGSMEHFQNLISLKKREAA